MATVFFVTLPFIGTATIRLSDLAFDVSKSIRPLVVSLGNTLSSSEPLREMRAELQVKIRNLVDELGPEAFDDFEETRILRKEDFSNNFDAVAAEKLGRSKTLDRINLFNSEAPIPINTVFGREVDRVKINF